MDDLQARLAAALAGRYTIEREIGRGGMSIVFLAFDPGLGRQVAIKVLRPELAASLGPDRFLDEIKVAARLRHPYILKLHEAGEGSGLLYYFMPFVEGETLRQRLARERILPLPDALRIAQEVAEALAHAHRQNVVHRDIKPENILFEEGHAVVSDFGIAKAISVAGDRRTVPGIVLGTVDYMSPEQERGIEDLDGRTDIYSLGLVLYEMLVGHTPGPDSGVDSLTGRRPEVPVEVVRILRTALARDPAHRFGSAAEMVSALQGLTEAPRLVDSRRRRLVIAGAAVGLTIGVLILSLRPKPETQPLDPTHIAVLYLDDLTPDSSLRHVATGLTEDLIDRLGSVSALSVTSPNGVRQYRGRDVAPDSLARALGVGTIVSGSLAQAGKLLRVRVRLVDGRTGQVLHSTPIDRPVGDLFALQDSLASDIAAFLRQRVGEAVVLRERRAGTKNVEAWETVRRADALRDDARAVLRDGDDVAATRGLLSADSLYRYAEALDPRWNVPVVALGRIAQAFGEQIAPGRPAATARAAAASHVPAAPHYADEWLRVALADAGRALNLRPDDPEALELRGSVRYRRWLQGYVTESESLTVAEEDLRAAVRGAPSFARGWYRLSLLLRFTGRFAEAEQAAQRALDADAFLLEARPVYATLYFSALNLGHYDDARARCRAAQVRFPNDLEFAHCELRIIGWEGHGRSAITRARRLIDSLEAGRSDARTGSFQADRLLLLAAVYARSGLRDSARAMLVQARGASQGDTTAAWFETAQAYVQTLLGDRTTALAGLARVVTANPQLRDYVARTPWFDVLHSDARFIALAGPR